MSMKRITLPYTPPEKPQYIRVKSIEVNTDTEQPEPGSGWWKTKYLDYIVKENKELLATISGTVLIL